MRIKSLADMRKFNRIKRELAEEEEKKPRRQRTGEEKKIAWAKRLSKLTGISVEDALYIAEEKLEYKRKEIEHLENRQLEHYSVKHHKLIDSKYRESPLRYIKDASHAYNILSAHDRHTNSDYEAYLEEAHELERWGDIDKGTAKEYARMHFQFGS